MKLSYIRSYCSSFDCNYFYFMYSFSSDKPCYTPRIMSRRFALTSTAYKYLDVGICVVSGASYVEIILGDNRGNRMALDYSMWTELNKKRAEIEQLLKTADASSPSSSSMHINDLILELVIMYGGKIVKLTFNNTCMYMKVPTVLFLFQLEHCVEHVYRKLCDMLSEIDQSFDQLVSCLRGNLIGVEKDDAVRMLHNWYDRSSTIDCELKAYVVDEIIAEAFKRDENDKFIIENKNLLFD
ncbi:PREDICTED: uncharacterized protein LOC105566679 [Vollenhovia emeryi]|uniref:uncharacterized protein LOC105566679 n=1 Tax=Vollenhovia emeryi TaxID=411798 RepID=UPI0005F5085A|nr:PREDICTED: uncharacterized protein LOC105566679 [Vollenhovia emeryi]